MKILPYQWEIDSMAWPFQRRSSLYSYCTGHTCCICYKVQHIWLVWLKQQDMEWRYEVIWWERTKSLLEYFKPL